MKILVGSENIVKINAVREVAQEFAEEFEVKGIKADSKVGSQPFGKDTLIGAKNRIKHIAKKEEADLYVSIEGGISNILGYWFGFGVCFAKTADKEAIGISPHYEIPEEIINRIRKGYELGEVMEMIAEKENIKQKEGAVGYFTKGRVSRKELYKPAVRIAFSRIF